MNRNAYIAARERITELRAKQRWHSIQEARKAQEILEHIHKEAELEDEIMQLELLCHRLRLERDNEMKASDSAWAKLKRNATWI